MPSKLKVLQVIPKLGYGGAETGCYDLAHYLYENNCDSFLITSGGELLKYVNKKKVNLIRLPVHSKNPILILINFFIISFIIFFYKINIVHARSRAPAWSCYFATRVTKAKFFTTFHGTYNFSNNIKKFYNSIMVRSDVIIAGSNFIFSHIKKNYSHLLTEKKKLLVIFRGINVDYFKPEAVDIEKEKKFLEKFKLDKSKKIILLPGRLTNWKGQEMFIESLNLLKTKDPNKKFIAIILGSDQGRSLFKKKLVGLVEKYRLNSNVIFIDNLHEMPLAYKISDIVVSGSIEPEAFGRVSVEAQSMQKLIIASNIGGSNETIIDEKTGFLFKAGDPNSLYQKLASIFDLSDDTIKYMGIEGRKNIIQKFNVEKMCFSTYSEYKKIIN